MFAKRRGYIVDENKITVIIHQNDEEKYQHLHEYIVKNIKVPYLAGKPLSVNFLRTIGGNRGVLFNQAARQTDARYKIYVHETVTWIAPELLLWVVDTFMRRKKAGMLGFLGSMMPITGAASDAKKRWGRYFQQGKVGTAYKPALFYQEVGLIDSQVIATCEDIFWDEECGDDFLGAAACLAMKKKGYEIIVPMISGKAFESEVPSEYDRQGCDKAAQKRFVSRHKEELQPLVSVLIPSYNEPDYCRVALESVLAQDYENIEIIIGDDSTDKRVEEMVQPYLKKYGNICYEHHEKPYGGCNNVRALLAACHGAYVNILLHDDVFFPGKISTMMSFMVEDTDVELGFVTSVRPYMIDGKYSADPVRLLFDQDYVVCGCDLGKKILTTCINVVGEMSTVLFRKELVRVEGDSEQPYHIGYFCGYEEDSMGDVSTWLNLLAQSKCVFIKEPLSAFRRTPTQSTWKPEIMLQSALDWLNMIVAAWLHRRFLQTSQDFETACMGWHDLLKYHILSQSERFAGELQSDYEHFLQEIEAVEHKDFTRVAQLAVANMVANGAKFENMSMICDESSTSRGEAPVCRKNQQFAAKSW